MPIKTQAQLRSELDATIFANPGGQITPVMVHALLLDMIDSAGTGGTNYAVGTGIATGAGSALASSLALFRAAGTAAGSGSAAGSAPTLSAQVTQFFNRLLTLPSSTRQNQYAALIDGLVADGVWSLLDVLCVAGADAATSLTNLVQASYGGSYFGIPTFTIDKGFGPDGTVSYIDTGVNPSTIVGSYSQNSASMGVWNLGTTQVDAAALRSAPNTNCEIWPKYHTGQSLWMVNNNGAENSATNSGDASGFYLATRTASNATAFYRNGTSLGTSGTASTAPENNELFVGFGVSAGAGWQFSSWAFGGALDSTKAVALYNRVQTYLQAIGAV